MATTNGSYSESLFTMALVSDGLRRGVRYYRLDGRPLQRLAEVMGALATDGEAFLDRENETEPEVGH
ncbi:MAG: hypothetical protein ACREQY_01910 [Candidatus Binatia bacterium]